MCCVVSETALFMCKKSMSLPYPWHVPTVSTPKLGIVACRSTMHCYDVRFHLLHVLYHPTGGIFFSFVKMLFAVFLCQTNGQDCLVDIPRRKLSADGIEGWPHLFCYLFRA